MLNVHHYHQLPAAFLAELDLEDCEGIENLKQNCETQKNYKKLTQCFHTSQLVPEGCGSTLQFFVLLDVIEHSSVQEALDMLTSL